MKMQQRQSHRSGFTLAELMVVIVIIGLLATAVVPKLMDSLGDAKWGRAKADVKTIESALTNYAIRNNGYPESLESLVTPDVNNRTYLDRQTVPTDPWGNEYGYEPSIDGGTPRITCFGADGQPGGEKDNQDKDNIMMKNDQWN
ncbi:MAG: general secretion pathway protein G [Chlamydiales bacterium]|jgi:general secretion pathway protein G